MYMGPYIMWNFTLLFMGNMLWLECSTFCLSGRWLMFFYGVPGGDWKHSVNSLIGSVIFLFGRTVFHLYSIAFVYLPLYYNAVVKEQHTTGQVIFFHWLTFIIGFSAYLNIHWSNLIIQQIGRIFIRGKKAYDDKHVELAEQQCKVKSSRFKQ